MGCSYGEGFGDGCVSDARYNFRWGSDENLKHEFNSCGDAEHMVALSLYGRRVLDRVYDLKREVERGDLTLFLRRNVEPRMNPRRVRQVCFRLGLLMKEQRGGQKVGQMDLPFIIP